jgi:hypothetical protein
MTQGILFGQKIPQKYQVLSNFDIKDIAANPVISGDKVYTISNNGRLVAIKFN